MKSENTCENMPIILLTRQRNSFFLSSYDQFLYKTRKSNVTVKENTKFSQIVMIAHIKYFYIITRELAFGVCI